MSQTPGVWAGSVVHTTNSSVTIMVEQSKWDKTKTKLKWVSCRLDEGADVEYKPLEKVRGFLNYVMQVYPSMIPYLRGIHGTLHLWRTNRTADGFDKRLNEEREEDQDVKRPPRKRRGLVSPATSAVEEDLTEVQFDLSNYSDPKFGLEDEEDSVEEEDSCDLEFSTGAAQATKDHQGQSQLPLTKGVGRTNLRQE